MMTKAQADKQLMEFREALGEEMKEMFKLGLGRAASAIILDVALSGCAQSGLKKAHVVGYIKDNYTKLKRLAAARRVVYEEALKNAQTNPGVQPAGGPAGGGNGEEGGSTGERAVEPGDGVPAV